MHWTLPWTASAACFRAISRSPWECALADTGERGTAEVSRIRGGRRIAPRARSAFYSMQASHSPGVFAAMAQSNSLLRTSAWHLDWYRKKVGSARRAAVLR
jgi:hypothetical protein